MRTEFHKVLQLKHYFRNYESTDQYVRCKFGEASMLLMNNIYVNWLQSVFAKTYKHMHMYTHKKFIKHNELENMPFGYLDNSLIKYNEDTIIECGRNHLPTNASHVQLNIIVPQDNNMQYFIQWQRYRKYWWSSITTTPSLFAVKETKYINEVAITDIVANFPWGQHIVETVAMESPKTSSTTSHLTCYMTLERAMFILLLDGINSKTEYLRLHRVMAPYKISIAVNVLDSAKKESLCELAQLIYYKLNNKSISACLPNFALSFEQQIRENLHLGITYTAILTEDTLTNGIFHLLNSSTMLKEQVHVADFEAYANILCR